MSEEDFVESIIKIIASEDLKKKVEAELDIKDPDDGPSPTGL